MGCLDFLNSGILSILWCNFIKDADSWDEKSVDPDQLASPEAS